MAADDTGGARPATPVVLRIKLRYDDVDAMVQRFAPNIGKSGLFLPTKSIQPVGTEVKFELRLLNDTPVLVGLGRVKHVRQPDPNNPKAAFGMALELTRVSREGRDVIMRMLERRRAMGLPEVAIPVPDDIETARRAEVDTQPKVDATTAIPEEAPSTGSAPVLSSPPPGRGPVAIARDEGSAPVAAPRASAPNIARDEGSAPIAAPRASAPKIASKENAAPAGSSPSIARGDTSTRIPVAALTPEKSRPRRPRVEELIERATELSARTAKPAVELDVQIDMQRAVSRARSLATGDLDGELAALRDAAAAPIEIAVDVASAELARQLGGKSIAKRERSGASARWAPPPAVELRSKPVERPAPNPAIDASPSVAPVPPPPAAAVGAPSVPASPTPSPSPVADDNEADFADGTEAVDEALLEAAVAAAASVEPAAVQDAIAKAGPTPRRAASSPSNRRALSEPEPTNTAQADEPRTSVLPEEENADAVFLANSRALTSIDRDGRHSGPFPAQDVTIDRPPSLLIDDNADVSSFEHALSEPQSRPPARRVYTPGDDGPGETTQPGDVPPENVSDVDVLAEADQADEDLLASHGEVEVTGGHARARAHRDALDGVGDRAVALDYARELESEYGLVADPVPHAAMPNEVAPAGSVDDFAARLELGDDDEQPPPSDEIDRQAAREFDAVLPDGDMERAPGAGRRLKRASSELFSDYTDAEDLPQPELDNGARMIDPDAILLEEQRRMRRHKPTTQPPLPGLPTERPKTGPMPAIQPDGTSRVAHTVARPSTPARDMRPKSPTSPTSVAKKPPPIPAAARKPPTQQLATVKSPKTPVPTPERADSDDGVIIDFDDE